MKSILDVAKELTSKDRRETYGDPRIQHALTEELFNIWKKFSVPQPPGVETCVFNILQKLSRQAVGGPGHPDTWIDTAGYAANAAECEEL